MPYNPRPPFHLMLGSIDMATDWDKAPAGKWFVGVIETARGQVYIAPTNPHQTFRNRTGFRDEVQNNNGPRSMNRYASGAAADRTNTDDTDYEVFRDGNFFGFTHNQGLVVHMALCQHFELDAFSCVGFTLIKLSTSIAQLKFGSASLHVMEGVERHNGFSLRTFHNTSQVLLGTPQMPSQWQQALVDWLPHSPLHVSHIAASLE